MDRLHPCFDISSSLRSQYIFTIVWGTNLAGRYSPTSFAAELGRIKTFMVVTGNTLDSPITSLLSPQKQ